MAQLDDLKAAERKVFAQAESEKKALNNLEATIKNFQELPAGQKCQQCGQLIGPEHKETELAFLQANLEIQRAKWNKLEQEDLLHRQQLDEKQKLLKEQEAKVEKLEYENQTATTSQNNSNTAITSHFQVLKSCYSQVPPEYREKIALTEPQQPKDWLNIVYPDVNELDKLRDELSRLDSVQGDLKDLERKIIDSEKLHDAQKELRSQMALMKSEINLEEAQIADQQLKQFKVKLEQVVKELKSLEKEIADNGSKLDKSTEACKKLNDTRESKEREKSRLEGSLEEKIKDISRAQQKVDKAYWAFTSYQLGELKLEQKSLGKYKGQKAALDEALKNHNSLQEKLKNIQEAINELPAAARRPQRAVQAEVESIINREKIADGELDKAIRELGIVRNKWQVRQEKEEELKKNQKSENLYNSLAILLGQKKGLQGYIFQQAEKVILAYANETLSNLSNGQLLLQIKPAEEEDSQIAFDLMVYNYAVGTMPMPINMVSGSQKFRIAVSLALAIGRFSSQDNRLIEAVIIDEGFGSLDKSNLNEMIQEINKLERILKKVILVSHQDEFAHAFSNRYKITLEDKTSHVERVIENFSAE